MGIVQPNTEWTELVMLALKLVSFYIIPVAPFQDSFSCWEERGDDHLQECCLIHSFTSTDQTLLLWLRSIQSTALYPGKSSRAEAYDFPINCKTEKIDGDELNILVFKWLQLMVPFQTHLLKRQVYRRRHTYKVVDKQNVRLCYYIFIKWVPTCCGETSNWRGLPSVGAQRKLLAATQHLEPLDAPETCCKVHFSDLFNKSNSCSLFLLLSLVTIITDVWTCCFFSGIKQRAGFLLI